METLKNYLKRMTENGCNNLLITTLAVFLIGVPITFWVNNSLNQKTFCINQIKDFNIKEFTFKDISVLHEECIDEIQTHNLYEDIIFSKSSNDKILNHFSRIIHELYLDKKISRDEIIDFLDLYIENIIKNNSYERNYDNTKIRNYNHFFYKYLLFKSNINMYSREEVEYNNLLHILKFLINKNLLFENNLNKINDITYKWYLIENNLEEIKKEKFKSLLIPTKIYELYQDVLSDYSYLESTVIENLENLDFDKDMKIKINEIINIQNLMNNKEYLQIKKALVSKLSKINTKPYSQLSEEERLEKELTFQQLQILLFKIANEYDKGLHKYTFDVIYEKIMSIENETNHIKKLDNNNYSETELILAILLEFSIESSQKDYFLTKFRNIELPDSILNIMTYNKRSYMLFELMENTKNEEYKIKLYTEIINILKYKNSETQFNNIIRDLGYELDKVLTMNQKLTSKYLLININAKLYNYPEFIEETLTKIYKNLKYMNKYDLKSTLVPLNNSKISRKARKIKLKILNELKEAPSDFASEIEKLIRSKNLTLPIK